jgi:NADH-quinone oxidoreductase subunit G
VTARKDQWGEVQTYDGKPGWICNDCRFHKKHKYDWEVEGLTNITRHSVISQGKYPGLQMPKETIAAVMGGKSPNLLMDIHEISGVNDPDIDLSKIEGPATSHTFNPNP